MGIITIFLKEDSGIKPGTIHYRIVLLANLLDHLWKLHFDALVTHTAFERDFYKHYNGVVNAHTRLKTGDEAAWLAFVEKRYKTGRTSSGERGID